jgi:hypothetical protein
MPDGPDMPHRPATFLAREWLHPSQPSIHGRGYLRRVVIALDFKTLQRRQIEGVLATLGGVLDPLITLVIHNSTLTLTTLERGNPALIPGMQTLRRFRGCRNINIVVDIPMPNLSVMVRTWSTTPHLQRRPTQAFLPRPYAQSTLMSRHNLSELRALAVQYGHDPSRYTQLPDGGDPKKKKDLVKFIHAEQAHEYYDSNDEQFGREPRSRPRLTPRGSAVATQTNHPPRNTAPESVAAISWIHEHV